MADKQKPTKASLDDLGTNRWSQSASIWLTKLTKDIEGKIQQAEAPVEEKQKTVLDPSIWQPGDIRLRENLLYYHRLWLNNLAKFITEKSNKFHKHSGYLKADESVTLHLMQKMQRYYNSVVLDFNTLLEPNLRASFTFAVSEIQNVAKGALDTKSGGGSSGIVVKDNEYFRFRLANKSWCLSARAKDAVVELFVLPARSILKLDEAERPDRLRATFRFRPDIDVGIWTYHDQVLDTFELQTILRNLFGELVLRSLNNTTESQIHIEDPSLAEAVENLIRRNRELAQKLVLQQEELQNTFARDLHDVVIADVMTIKRLVAGNSENISAELQEITDGIIERLRDICQDMAPRNLRDWGLPTVLQDLTDTVAKRNRLDCTFVCYDQLPDLPESVQLHLYRIAQEALNNAVKYAKASRLVLEITYSQSTLVMSVADNGKGFLRSEQEITLSKVGGRGIGGLQERVEMIRCYFPCQMEIDSMPEKGTRLTVKLQTVAEGAQ